MNEHWHNGTKRSSREDKSESLAVCWYQNSSLFRSTNVRRRKDKEQRNPGWVLHERKGRWRLRQFLIAIHHSRGDDVHVLSHEVIPPHAILNHNVLLSRYFLSSRFYFVVILFASPSGSNVSYYLGKPRSLAILLWAFCRPLNLVESQHCCIKVVRVVQLNCLSYKKGSLLFNNIAQG